jgi:hypothetical protein
MFIRIAGVFLSVLVLIASELSRKLYDPGTIKTYNIIWQVQLIVDFDPNKHLHKAMYRHSNFVF